MRTFEKVIDCTTIDDAPNRRFLVYDEPTKEAAEAFIRSRGDWASVDVEPVFTLHGWKCLCVPTVMQVLADVDERKTFANG